MGVVAAASSSCTEEKIYGIDPNAIPQASDYAVKVEVNQETNQVSLSLTDKSGNPAMGVYPVWKVYTKNNPVLSTRPVYTDIITIAGDYDVEVQVANHHGISDGVQTSTIHIENTLVDFSPYILFLTNNDSKVWQIAANEQGHLGCGESGTDGLNWWSAAPYDKKDWGVYENRMTFTDNGGNSTGLYTYDPGESGTIYINKEITDLPPYSASNPNDDNDYCAPAEVQADHNFTLVPEGVDLYLVLPEGTLMAYLPNMDQFNNPKWKIIDMNKNKIELVCDNGGIAWHYLLQPEGADAGSKPFEGFKYDSEFNMWKNAEVVLQSTWFSPSDWSGSCVQPDVEVSNETIKFHTPADMGNDQWMGQVHIGTNIEVSAAETYDFSCFVKAATDIKATVKVQKDGDDNVSFAGQDQIAFDAGGSYYYFSDLPGFDGLLKIAFDFGGNPDMDIEIAKIVFKNHKDDDGTVLPGENAGGDSEDPAVSVDWVAVDSPDNLWNGAEITEITSWTSPSDWSGSTPEPEVTQDGNSFTLQYTEAPGGDQWQAQFGINTNLSFSVDKKYDFRVTINPSCDIAGATVKPTNYGDDAFWSDGRHDLEAYEDNVIQLIGVSADMPDFKIVFDFAGVAANATVVVKDIIIQEHKEFSWEDVNSEANLWNGANISELTSWTSPSDWSGSTPEPEITQEGNSFTLQYSEAPGGDQWQAQFGINTDLSFPGDKSYDFRVTINPTCDIAGATVKPTNYGDDAFWSDGRHDLEAYEDNVIELKNVSAEMPDFKIVFDFAGVEANAKVVVKDIIIQEHK